MRVARAGGSAAGDASMAMTIVEFSQRIGVSTATVWRALNDAKGIRPETRDMVLRRMKELGYQPNQAARALVRGQSEVIAVWMPSIGTQYDALVLQNVEKQLLRDNYEMFVRDMNARWHRNESMGYLLRWPVDGIIVVDAAMWVRNALIGHRGSRPPMVGIGAYNEEPIDYVAVDLTAGAYEAVRHLISLGRRRVAYLVPRQFNAPDEARMVGYMRAMREADLEPELIVTAVSNRPAAAQGIEDYLLQHKAPEALFCFNDNNAIGAFCRMREMGVRVPDDVAIVGCDGIEDTMYVERKLSTIVIPLPEMCAVAWQFLRRRMKTPAMPRQRLVLQPSLVIRESSTGRPAPSPAPRP